MYQVIGALLTSLASAILFVGIVVSGDLLWPSVILSAAFALGAGILFDQHNDHLKDLFLEAQPRRAHIDDPE